MGKTTEPKVNQNFSKPFKKKSEKVVTKITLEREDKDDVRR